MSLAVFTLNFINIIYLLPCEYTIMRPRRVVVRTAARIHRMLASIALH